MRVALTISRLIYTSTIALSTLAGAARSNDVAHSFERCQLPSFSAASSMDSSNVGGGSLRKSLLVSSLMSAYLGEAALGLGGVSDLREWSSSRGVVVEGVDGSGGVDW